MNIQDQFLFQDSTPGNTKIIIDQSLRDNAKCVKPEDILKVSEDYKNYDPFGVANHSLAEDRLRKLKKQDPFGVGKY